MCQTSPSHEPANRSIGVAHLIHTVAYGGVETAVLNWLETIDKDHFAITLICFKNTGDTQQPFVDAARARGFVVKTIPWSRRKPVVRAARRLAQILRDNCVDVVHCHNTYANMVGLLAAWMVPVKTVTTLYVWGNFGFVRNALQWIDRALLPFFDQVTAHCQQTFQGTLDRGYPESKLRLLPCGYQANPVSLATQQRAVMRARLGACPEQCVFITVARFWPEKAHDVLLEAFSDVLAQGKEAKLWLLGVGPLQPRIEALVRSIGLQERVVFLGFRDDLATVLALADVQVHPSHMEGVPLAVCQGMAQGLPVVATRVGGLTEIVKDGVSGLLVESRSPKQLANALLSLIEDTALRTRLGEEAQRFIAEEYSLQAATRRVQQLYIDMLTRAPIGNSQQEARI